LAAAIIDDMGKAIGGNAVIEKRLAGAQGLSDHDGHALAGFLDAEGSFTIGPNNGGRTWSCVMSVAVRLDDGDMLTDLARSTGLGRVAAHPARRGSRPQARWTIASKRECAELVRMLRRWPLRARKHRDFEIWARAVDRWAAIEYATRSDPVVHHAMAQDSALIRQVRRYVDLPPAAIDGPADAMLAYLGGFFSGEGSFGLSGLQPRAVIKLRRDDRSILELFEAHFSIGRVRDRASCGGGNPAVTWLICATDELQTAVSVFEAAQLRGRKRREFEVWRRAAKERAAARSAGRRWSCDRVALIARRLSELRAYRPQSEDISKPDAARDARITYAGVLRTFAAEVIDRPLTCSAYAEARKRHPEWPTRNTIALAFGTWDAGLRAVGLGSRASSWARARGR
jgi:LAGLIDADG DNA endonuclease family protein